MATGPDPHQAMATRMAPATMVLVSQGIVEMVLPRQPQRSLCNQAAWPAMDVDWRDITVPSVLPTPIHKVIGAIPDKDSKQEVQVKTAECREMAVAPAPQGRTGAKIRSPVDQVGASHAATIW